MLESHKIHGLEPVHPKASSHASEVSTWRALLLAPRRRSSAPGVRCLGGEVSSCFLGPPHSCFRSHGSTMFAAILLLAVTASAQKDDFGFAAPPRSAPPPPPPVKPLWFLPSSGSNSEEKCNQEGERALTDDSISIFESPTSEIFIPEGQSGDICIFFAPPHPQKWQLGAGVAYSDKSCSEGCCFYTPASSKRVQEIEAKVEASLPEWFRTPAGGCESGPGAQGTTTSRLILNTANNVCISSYPSVHFIFFISNICLVLKPICFIPIVLLFTLICSVNFAKISS